jgi:hypothetical protein
MNKKREEMKLVREREFELRLEQKRLEMEVMAEMRKPLVPVLLNFIHSSLTLQTVELLYFVRC